MKFKAAVMTCRQNHLWRSAGNIPPSKVGAAKQPNLLHTDKAEDVFLCVGTVSNFSFPFSALNRRCSCVSKVNLWLELTIFLSLLKFSTTGIGVDGAKLFFRVYLKIFIILIYGP